MSQTFSEIIHNPDWCGSCRIMKSVVEEVKQKDDDDTTIIKADVDKNYAASKTNNVTSMPTLIISKMKEGIGNK